MDDLHTEDRSSAKSAAVFVRMTASERARFEAAAKAEDRTVANWLRRLGRLAAESERNESQ